MTETDLDVDRHAEDEVIPSGRHSESEPGAGKGVWLTEIGVDRSALAGKIVTVAAYKGGVGKTFLAYELAYLLGAVVLDLDWDKGNLTRAWGYREEDRIGSVLLNAIATGRTPRPLTGGPWKPDLVPCSRDFSVNQPSATALTALITDWARKWGEEYGSPLVVDTHPGGHDALYAATSAANSIIVPAIMGEREMEATADIVDELKAYPLLLVPNDVPRTPPEKYITRLERIAAAARVPVAPPISNYPWLRQRSRRQAITAAATTAKYRPLVDQLHAVARRVVDDVRAA